MTADRRATPGRGDALPAAMTLPAAALLCAVAILRGAGAAQAPTPSAEPAVAATADAIAPQTPADLDELARAVEAAHKTPQDAPPIHDFDAALQLADVGRNADRRGQIELVVRYLDWKKPDGRSWPLIRYRQTDSARVVEQGRDRDYYWLFADGALADMQSSEREADKADCRRNLKLAGQMTQFFAPGRVLRSLQSPSPVEDGELKLGRRPRVACRVVRGTIPGFPVRRSGGENAPVQARVYVEKSTGLLQGLEVTPLDDKGLPQTGAGEFLSFERHEALAGRVVPMLINYFEVDAAGERELRLKIEVKKLALDAGLSPDDFDHPK